ncbi:MAG: prenyltransferase [Candidatus Bathyarchaeota archaeon]|nr:prenyltransferase [Candidatus Bathyarchaeota archaeon]
MNNSIWSSATILRVLIIIRIHIVAGGALAFSIGALLAVIEGGSFNPARVILGYLVVFFGDLSTHYSNDYFDVEIDKYIEQRKFFAGSGILVDYPKLRPLSRSIAISLIMLSNVLGSIAVLFYGVPIEFLMITIGANLVGWFYSAPPLRLTSRGLGEIAIALVTGLVIPSAGYLVVKGQFDPFFISLTVPFMMYGFMLSLSLEAPDIEIDRKGGRRNLAVRKGKLFIFSLILAMSSLATIMFLIYAWRIMPTIIDLGIVVLFSIIPLIAGFFGFLKIKIFNKGEDINRLSTLNIGSLFLFNILLNGYFISFLL